MKVGAVLILVTLLVTIQCKGVTQWCSHNNKFIYTYTSGNYAYSTLSTAKSQCLARSDCFGVVWEKGNRRYTLRKTWQLQNSPSGEITYIPCAGYFNCAQFGLKSVHGKFLSAQSDGDVEWNRSEYGSWEHVTFEQFGKSSGALKSTHGKYLAATDKEKLEWNRSWKGSWEQWTVEQYEDKIALKSYHGKYLSAQSNGDAEVDRAKAYSWEWFTVHPQSCLRNIECDCTKQISKADYDFAGVVYHTTQGAVQAFQPEEVGYQKIDNTDGTIAQSSTFTVSESVTETSSFTHTAGASVTVGTEFSAGIPVLAEGKISVEVTASYEYSAGKEKSVTITKSAEYNCVAPPGKSVTCQALLFKYRMSVPYTQTWAHKRLPCTCESTGTFTELTASEMQLTITEN